MPCVSVIMDRLSGDLPIYYSALTWAYYTMLRFCLTQHQHKPPVVDPLIDGLACWVAGCPPPPLPPARNYLACLLTLTLRPSLSSPSLFVHAILLFSPLCSVCLTLFYSPLASLPIYRDSFSKAFVFYIHCCTKYILHNLGSASFLSRQRTDIEYGRRIHGEH